MEEQINNASLSFKCKENWDAMTPEADGRFCGVCQKKVYDLTDKKAAYFIQIMQENNNNVCGRFSSDQLIAPAQSSKPIWKKWAIAAMVFIGIGTAGQEANAQEKMLGKVAPKVAEPDCDKIMTMGIVMPPITAAEELRSLHGYIAQHSKVPASTNGRMIVSFSIRNNGSLSKIALTEQLPKAVRDEVLKAIKTAHKWNVQKKNDTSRYTMHLTFKNGKILPYGS